MNNNMKLKRAICFILAFLFIITMVGSGLMIFAGL